MVVKGVAQPQVFPPISKQENSDKPNRKSDKNSLSPAITYVQSEISFEYDVYSLKTIKQNNAADKNEQEPAVEPAAQEIDAAEIRRLKQLIHEEVLAQVKDSLGAFFSENPEAAEEISRGEIPEYFNVENTARRILMLYIPHYHDGEDKQAFVEQAKKTINQAYGDVEGLVGILPEIVLRTKEFIMEMLEKFADGEDIYQFLNSEHNK